MGLWKPEVSGTGRILAHAYEAYPLVMNLRGAPTSPLRDWSLITGRWWWGGGGATKLEGGGTHVKVYPYKKKEGGGSFSLAEGGGAQKALG